MAIYVKLWEKLVNMFKGIHNINTDSKGRLAIPTKYRTTILDRFDGNMVITIDSEEKCLLLYTLSAWEKIQSKSMLFMLLFGENSLQNYGFL